MKIERRLLLLSSILLSGSGIFGQDLKVFDLKLGDSMKIRESSCVIAESASKHGIAVKKNKWRGLFGKKPDISKMYQYTENVATKDKCFQRVGLYYTEPPTPGTPEAKNLPPVLPPNNEKVKLIYSADTRPGIADAKDIWIGIQNHKLTGIRFYFTFHKADSVFQTLIKKYGKPTSRQDYFITAPGGSRKDYYEAKWNFSTLKVTFLSTDVNNPIGYNPNDAPLGYLSDVGSVTIQYLVSEPNERKDNNKL